MFNLAVQLPEGWEARSTHPDNELLIRNVGTSVAERAGGLQCSRGASIGHILVGWSVVKARAEGRLGFAIIIVRSASRLACAFRPTTHVILVCVVWHSDGG